MNQLIPANGSHVPALIAADGARASYRFFEFFTAQIRNPNTRRAYAARPSNSSTGFRRRA
jgi:integrase/recombinase XerD